MLTDEAGLTRSPSLPLGGNNPSPAQTHTHSERPWAAPSYWQICNSALTQALPPLRHFTANRKHTHTHRTSWVCSHTHTLENFLPAYTTHKSQAQTCTHRDKCTPENMHFTTKTLNDTLTSSTGWKNECIQQLSLMYLCKQEIQSISSCAHHSTGEKAKWWKQCGRKELKKTREEECSALERPMTSRFRADGKWCRGPKKTTLTHRPFFICLDLQNWYCTCVFPLSSFSLTALLQRVSFFLV